MVSKSQSKWGTLPCSSCPALTSAQGDCCRPARPRTVHPHAPDASICVGTKRHNASSRDPLDKATLHCHRAQRRQQQRYQCHAAAVSQVFVVEHGQLPGQLGQAHGICPQEGCQEVVTAGRCRNGRLEVGVKVPKGRSRKPGRVRVRRTVES